MIEENWCYYYCESVGIEVLCVSWGFRNCANENKTREECQKSEQGTQDF